MTQPTKPVSGDFKPTANVAKETVSTAAELLSAAKQGLADLQGGFEYIKHNPDAIDATILTLKQAIAKAEQD